MDELNTILAAQVTFLLKRGDPVSIPLSFTDPNNGDAYYDLSVFTELTMQVKTRRNAPTSVATLTLTGGDFTVTGVDDEILTIILDDAAVSIKAAEYFYDVEGVSTANPDGLTILEGLYIIEEDVTRTP